MVSLSSEIFKYWIVKRDPDRIKIVFQDGRELEAPVDHSREPLPTEIAYAILDWERWWIANVTKRGHILIAEVYNPKLDDPTRGRPSVYLDQNHWRSVAQTRVDTSQIKSGAEARSAQRVADLAQDLGIILPLSSGHVRETAPLFGDLRYNVGATMASLSAGWQLRHPSAVWMMEAIALVCELTSQPVPPYCEREAVTLEPGAMNQQAAEVNQPAPTQMQQFIDLLGAPSVVLEMLIDPESVKAADLAEWTTGNQRITEYVSKYSDRSSARRRAAIDAFWRSNFAVIRQAGAMVGTDVEHLLETDTSVLYRALQRQPMLRFVGGLHIMRYMDRVTQWKPNDLTDIMFLGCAAGYCDYVVAERHTGEQLRSLQRAKGESVTVFTSIDGLRDQLDALDIQTDSERANARSESLGLASRKSTEHA